MKHSDFVHLHVHTQYSLLDGACHLDRLIEKARSLNCPALAITDHGNLFGAVKFYSQCVAKGIKPLIGCEVYVAPDSRFKKEYKQSEESNYHLILLAKNEQGYKNLLRLTSQAFAEGFYYKPRVDKELLQEYAQGLIGMSACLKGEIASAIAKDKVHEAYKCADSYHHIFEKGDFYLELMENGIPEQTKVNQCLIKMSRDLDLPLVATNDVHYIEKNEAFAQEVLLCIQTQSTLQDPNRFKFGSESFYFRSPGEMKQIFKEVPTAIKNTLEIMQKCNILFDFSQVHLPRFPLPQGVTDNEYLRKLCEQKISQRFPASREGVAQRLDYELKMIERTGFSSYFLIISDLVNYARENNIPVGPGRGSAAGSIVSYLLGITDIDPLKYNLLFERFLNPERVNMPDIDIDFCYEKRSKIIEYVAQKYGKENVAQIITFGTMQARAVIRDVGRVMGFSYSEVDRIAKMIPAMVGHSVHLKEALKSNEEFMNTYQTDNRVKQLVDVAVQLEGLARHASTHAAGVVISDKPLIERIPLTLGSEGEMITGFDMESVEKTGLLKMDFLGLKTLTVIEQTVAIIKRTRGLSLDINSISLEDAKTFDLLVKGETIGIFQLESRGMRELLKKLGPKRFEDLIAVLALYRPGPLGSGMVDDYIERKQGRKPISYLHPKLEDILKETYGIILYQEQTMQIASSLGGFSLAQADLLRKAIGKKIPEIMDEQKELFVQGCKKNKISEKVALSIFDLIDYFSGYGFNKSHSTAYAMISYRTAYLKANFCVEYMAALLTSERNNTDKVVRYVNESSRMGIKVLPPDINESFAHFTVTKDGNIRFGLMAIKNVGGAAIENIIEIREEKEFESFFDFCDRIDTRVVNRKVNESLIKSGAMDGFGLKRAQMMLLLDKLLDKASKRAKGNSQQLLLFENIPMQETVPEVEEWPQRQILNFEKSLLGIYVSSHPLEMYRRITQFLDSVEISALYEEKREQDIMIVGVIAKVKRLTTRRSNEQMAIVRVEDQTGSVEMFVFPRIYESVALLLVEGKVVVVKGALQLKDKMPKVIANNIIPVEEVFSHVRELRIHVTQEKEPLLRLRTIFLRHKGTTPVSFVLKNSRLSGVKIKTSQDFHLALSEAVLKEISQVLGEENFFLTL